MTPTPCAGGSGAVASHVPWLLQGPLFRSGGVAVVDGIADERTIAALCAEAQANYAMADRQVCDVVTSDNCDGRGGVPPRQLSTAPGGLTQDELYRSPYLHAFLSQLCGGPIRPSGSRGSYSYYVAPADYLGLHLDIVTCDVTVISVLADSSPDNGGALAVQRGSVGRAPVDPSTVRACPRRGRQGTCGIDHRHPRRLGPAPRAAVGHGAAGHLRAVLRGRRMSGIAVYQAANR